MQIVGGCSGELWRRGARGARAAAATLLPLSARWALPLVEAVCLHCLSKMADHNCEGFSMLTDHLLNVCGALLFFSWNVCSVRICLTSGAET